MGNGGTGISPSILELKWRESSDTLSKRGRKSLENPPAFRRIPAAFELIFPNPPARYPKPAYPNPTTYARSWLGTPAGELGFMTRRKPTRVNRCSPTSKMASPACCTTAPGLNRPAIQAHRMPSSAALAPGGVMGLSEKRATRAVARRAAGARANLAGTRGNGSAQPPSAPRPHSARSLARSRRVDLVSRRETVRGRVLCASTAARRAAKPSVEFGQQKRRLILFCPGNCLAGGTEPALFPAARRWRGSPRDAAEAFARPRPGRRRGDPRGGRVFCQSVNGFAARGALLKRYGKSAPTQHLLSSARVLLGLQGWCARGACRAGRPSPTSWT